jgi:hypothetical protein
MLRNYDNWKPGLILIGIGFALVGPGRPAEARQDPVVNAAPQEAEQPVVAEGVEVQKRGPVHEAFAEPLVDNPGPGPVVPRQPPDPIQELSPDQKPEGDDVQWVPGSWSWDDDRSDFIWVSGIWRDVPLGRQWVVGYWDQVDGGFRWIAGAWTPIEQDTEQARYLPTPPLSLEAGPNTPRPDGDSVWTAGCWYWHESRYVWRPGCWVAGHADWVPVPPHYVYTPRGCLFVEGYWDHALERRGLLYAPARIDRSVLARTRFAYKPSVRVDTKGKTDQFPVRPRNGHEDFSASGKHHPPIRLRPVHQQDRDQVTAQARALHQFKEQRAQHEARNANTGPLKSDHAPSLPRSPIMSRRQGTGQQQRVSSLGHRPGFAPRPTHSVSDHRVPPSHPGQTVRPSGPPSGGAPVEPRTRSGASLGTPRGIGRRGAR